VFDGVPRTGGSIFSSGKFKHIKSGDLYFGKADLLFKDGT
jgi:hypothetical protein